METILIIGWIILTGIVGYNLYKMRSLIADILVEVKKFNKKVKKI